MMDNPINGGNGHQGVRKDMIPLANGLIRGDN
jgi:hypothetical protein